MYNKRNRKKVETYIPRQYYVVLMDVFTGPIKMCTEHKKKKKTRDSEIIKSKFHCLGHRKTKHPHMKNLHYSFSPKIIYKLAWEMCVCVYIYIYI